MRKKKGKNSLMSLKIDLSKAYDQISWDFLRMVLVKAGLPEKCLSLAISCVTYFELVVLWNGKKKWKPIKIRRRCPSISHLFFAVDLVLFAEAYLDYAGS